ncbi:hypothetical protein L596_028362 [Steinernema carpocapsae]|uniref:Sodium/potassium-transporting ATPase subunit alpha n=1 Tax=Steinernema carpocapsae TaxID=34508 RepID=A0A4U5LY75_STECR|nr:hypothetical protein L596_028362 [Steinernema carpocapsae]
MTNGIRRQDCPKQTSPRGAVLLRGVAKRSGGIQRCHSLLSGGSSVDSSKMLLPRLPWQKEKKDDESAKLEDLKKDIDIVEHKIPIQELYEKLGTDPDKGLTESKAAKLLLHGCNGLTPKKEKSKIVFFFINCFTGLNNLLWFGSAAALIGWAIEMKTHEDYTNDHLFLSIVLVCVILITTMFQFYQETKSSNIMKSFKDMIPPKATVIRDGKEIEVEAKNLVIGDIVLIQGGDRVPADVRIISARGLKVDNSSLTGENEPVLRTPEKTSDNPLETRNLAFFSTNVVEGTGKGVVVLTGDNTIMGRIAALVATVSSGETPIAKEIVHFIHIIAVLAVIPALIFFILALCTDHTFIDSLIILVGIIVAMVPEGIPCTLTVSLTLTARKMSRKACLVKNLQAVETLGSTSTICSDKTGTLTQNRMTATHLWVVDKITELDGVFERTLLKNASNAEQLLTRAGALCSRASFKDVDRHIPVEKRQCKGDASEVAIMRFCEVATGNVEEFRAKYPKVCEIPFNSMDKYAVSIHKQTNGRFLLTMKGAPEKIIARCSTIVCGNEVVPLQPKQEQFFDKAYEELGGQGERVLGFCDCELDSEKFPENFEFDPDNPNFPMDNLRFIGLISMIDPARPGVPEAIKVCQTAGIKVVMVTGDHPITAKAIARAVNIFRDRVEVQNLLEDHHKANFDAEKEDSAIIINGEQLKRLEQENLREIIAHFDQIVFARTSPTQKLQIVEAFQDAGEVVAVTGDGVNDAPALRKADIGVAMGIAGTEVSKQAADMILLNDNFASIVTGIEEGRLIFDNLKKSIAYTLTSNIPQITPFLFHIVFSIPLPLSIIAVLCIDLGTDLWPAISIAYEAPESDIMKRPPRNPNKDRLVGGRLMNFASLQIGMMQAAAGFMTYFVIMAHNGFLPGRLFWLRKEWDDKHINDLEDSFGQEWEFEDRKSLERCCYSGFFAAIVIVQWADLLISKTRMISIVNQSMENHSLNASIIFTVLLTIALLFIPGLNQFVGFVGIRYPWAMIAVPFAWLIFIFDEARRSLIRKWPGGWLYRETYY